MHEYYGARTFSQTQGSWLHRRDHADALVKGIMTVDITIHDMMSTLWQKGAGDGQLQATVRTSY